MSNDQTNAAELAALLDISLNDLADMPSSKPYPNGAHVVTVSKMGPRKAGENTFMDVKFAYVSVKELADETAEVPKAGDEAMVAFNLGNEYGQGDLKNFVKPLFEATNTGTLGELIQALKGMELEIVTKNRDVADKKTGEVRTYMSVKKVSVA